MVPSPRIFVALSLLVILQDVLYIPDNVSIC